MIGGLGSYWVADYLFVVTLIVAAMCLGRGHRLAKIDLWDTVTATDRNGVRRTDARKLFEAGAFVVMTVGFAHMVVQGKLTEFYAAIYVASWVAAKSLRDREQRLNRELELKAGETETRT